MSILRSLALQFGNFASKLPLLQAARHSRRALHTLGNSAGRWAVAQGLVGSTARASAFRASAGLSAGASSLFPATFDFKEMGLLNWLLVDLAINVAGGIVAATFKTDMFFDALGSLSFLTLTVGSLLLPGPITPRKILVSCMAGVWAARLGTYLVTRIVKAGKDSRFDEVKHQPLTFMAFWVIQAMWVFVTLSPVLVVNTSAVTAPLAILDLIGVSLFAIGFGFEVVADWQKDVFRSNPDNKGKFIQEGLWSISRHPNYFGEALLWWGVFFTCARSFTAAPQYASVAGPIFVYMLLRYVSGIPILERQADARWGHLDEYQRYKASTPILFPFPPSKSSHSA